MSAQGDDAWAATNYMKEHVVVVEYEPEDRAGFVSVGWPGFAGVATGLSAHGITASALVVQTMRNMPFATPACFLYRRIMEETQTLEEGIELLRRARRTQGHNVLLASGDEGRAAVVEYTPWRFAVRSPEDGWIATTNHFNHPEMVRRYANTTFLSSTERLERLGELCGCHAAPVGEVGEAAQFLLDRRVRAGEANEYCAVWNPCTIYSTVFEPARRRMWVRASDMSERSFELIEIAAGGGPDR
jgi:predicted choloylglycine hydrolase